MKKIIALNLGASKPAFSLYSCILLLYALSPNPLWDSASAAESGEQLFLNNCAECHQRNGEGIPNVYPALAGSEVVGGSGVDVALVLLIGRGEMPSFAGSIAHDDMAKIINYVRNAWGNSGGGNLRRYNCKPSVGQSLNLASIWQPLHTLLGLLSPIGRPRLWMCPRIQPLLSWRADCQNRLLNPPLNWARYRRLAALDSVYPTAINSQYPLVKS